MAYEILAVTFEIDAQKTRDGQFTVPKPVRDILGLNFEKEVHLVIENSTGQRRTRVKQLKSGPEIYDTEANPDLREFVKAGQRIKVTASRSQ
jgi:bifunctional DNA-binding transcriptional regulator/antitoxin component of YhaV-PrlF toxin-antitoxin module